MYKLRISISSDIKRENLKNIDGICHQQENIILECSKGSSTWVADNGNKYFLIGNLVGFRGSDGIISPFISSKTQLESLESKSSLKSTEGRFILVKLALNSSIEIWADNYSRMDVYWQKTNQALFISSGLDLLPISLQGGPSDPVGTAHSLTVFGCRPAKKHTLYQDVGRLGVGQSLSWCGGDLIIIESEFIPLNQQPLYEKKDLNFYAEALFESIRSRASNDGNVVYLSSGWDSTSILSILVYLFGNRKVRAVIGRMRYSERSGVINQFEIDRAKAFADYYKIKLDIAEFDYRDHGPTLLDQIRPLLRSQQFSIFTGLTHSILAKKVFETANGKEAIFAGEMSDGAHNLGFSQFATIFHPSSYEFREYSDKMASYLFGPTFLNVLQRGEQEKDPIWNIFKERNAHLSFDERRNERGEITQQLLASFFLRGSRLPLSSMENSKLLTNSGRDKYSIESEKAYLKPFFGKVNGDNLYAYYLHLYNSFHWQSSTVSTLEYTAAEYGFNCHLPFNDSGVKNFLSAMPESWGRGLDLNPTKYPLKWFLKEKVDYPDFLQVGPHSYTYDIDPNFTLVGEILNSSSFTKIFKSTLKGGDFTSWLNREVFDHEYIDRIIKKYLGNEKLTPGEMNDVVIIGMHSAIGQYQ